VDVEGDHACVVPWRGRIYVFWVTFVDQQAQAYSGTARESAEEPPANLNGRIIRYRLNWTELLKGTWAGPFGVFVEGGSRAVAQDFDASRLSITVAKEFDAEGQERAVLVNLFASIFGLGTIRLATPNAPPRMVTTTILPSVPYDVVPGTGALLGGSGDLNVTFVSTALSALRRATEKLLETAPILAQGGSYSVVTSGDPYAPPPSEFGPLIAPFFYQDEDNTFFVEPDLTVTALERWNDWVPPAVRGEPRWRDPKWWEDLPIEIQAADSPPRLPIDPGDPAPWVGIGGKVFQKAPDLTVNPAPSRDWVTAPGALVAFGERVIGPAGGLDLVRVGAAGIADGAGPLVAVQPGMTEVLGETAVQITQPDISVEQAFIGVANSATAAHGAASGVVTTHGGDAPSAIVGGAQQSGVVRHVIGSTGVRPDSMKVVGRGFGRSNSVRVNGTGRIGG
jgi:hypothetical protein